MGRALAVVKRLFVGVVVLFVFALPARAQAPLSCRFTTTDGTAYQFRLSPDTYAELSSLGQGMTTTVRYHGQTYTVTNVGAETNQLQVTSDAGTTTGILSCTP